MASALLGSLLSLSFAQVDPDEERPGGLPDLSKQTKAQELKTFHGKKVVGTDAATRASAYKARLKLESDSVFSQIKWRNVGPETQSGRVVDITAPLGDPQQVFVAFATGGLWRTEDDGMSWTSLFDNQASFGIGAVAVSRDGKTIWVGSGESNSQRTSYAGDGVYKSTDGGATWTNMGLPESQHIGQVLIDPKNENTVWVAAIGHLYSEGSDRGVYKTTDGGKTWALVLKGADSATAEMTGCIDMAMDPRNPNVVYASMWTRDRRAWNFLESGDGSALLKTTDGGKTWKKMDGVSSGADAGRIGLAICRSKPDSVFAFVDHQQGDPDWADADERVQSGRLTTQRFLLLDEDKFLAMDRKVLDPFLKANLPADQKVDDVYQKVKDKKMTLKEIRKEMEDKNPTLFTGPGSANVLFRSDDAGKTWKRTEVSNFAEMGGYYWGKMAVDPTDANNLYVMGLPLMHSTDGGTTWKSIGGGAHVDYHAVWFDPRNTKKVWIGNDGGTYLSYDGGDTTRHLNNLSVGQTTTLALDNKTPYNLYVGLQDNGTMRGPSSYRPGRSPMSQWVDIGGGDGSAVAVDPREGNEIVYTASQFGGHGAQNTTTGDRWNARPAAPKGDPPMRFNWISPIVLSPSLPDIVYVGAQRLYRSFDQGRRFQPISPDLTKNLPQGDVPYSTIKDISESPLRFGLIYVGTDDGNVQMTPDGGFQWSLINTPNPDKWVCRVVASKWDEKTVYAAQTGYREDDFKPYLWRSTDYGKNWTSIVGNLPMESINVVREDPNHKEILYVGTDMGVYVTFDGGQTWETLSGALPHTPVHDLQIQAREEDLVIATHGRSVWILPLAKIYSTTPAIRGKDLTLFPVDDYRRSGNLGYERKERWDTSPATAPKISATLFTKDPGAGTLTIKDKDGKVVKQVAFDAARGYNFVDLSLELVAAKPGTANPKDRKVTSAEDVLKDPREADRAQYVRVGEYTLELKVGDKVLTQKWKVTGG